MTWWRTVGLVMFHHVLQRLGSDKGSVAIEYQDGSGSTGNSPLGLLHGMAGTQLLGLGDIRDSATQCLADKVCAVAYHYGQDAGFQAAGGVNEPADVVSALVHLAQFGHLFQAVGNLHLGAVGD